MSTRLVFNGKEYASVDEMPPDVRRAYQKVVALLAGSDRNDAADLTPDSSSEHKLNITRLRFLHDGKEYSSLEEMPPDARRHYQEAVSQLGEAGRDGIPDILPGEGATGSVEGNRHIVVRTTQKVRLEGVDPLGSVKSLLFSVGKSALLAALAGIVALVILVLWKLF